MALMPSICALQIPKSTFGAVEVRAASRTISGSESIPKPQPNDPASALNRAPSPVPTSSTSSDGRA
jgi:hypothetical protein